MGAAKSDDLFPDVRNPEGIQIINERCLIRTQAQHRVVLVSGIVLAQYALSDPMAEAYARVHLVEQRWATQAEVARAFDCSTRTVRRDQRRFEEGGLAALGRPDGYPLGRARLTGSRRWLVEQLKGQGHPQREIARRIGVGENALRYLSRYVFKTATANRKVPRLPGGQLRWDYRDSKTGQPASLTLEPLEWMARFLQHILPRSFARVRAFGWLHPAAKVRANRVRALLRQPPVLTPAETQTWHPPPDPDLEPPSRETVVACCAPLCPRCQHVMRLAGAWRPGQALLDPKRPP